MLESDLLRCYLAYWTRFASSATLVSQGFSYLDTQILKQIKKRNLSNYEELPEYDLHTVRRFLLHLSLATVSCMAG